MDVRNQINGVLYFYLSGTDSGDFPEKSSFDRIWLIRIRDGESHAHCNYNPVTLSEGSCWLLTDEVSFRFQSSGDDFQADVISMSIRFLDSVYFSIGPLMPPTMSVSSTEHMKEEYAELIASGIDLLLQTLESPATTGKTEMLRSLATHLLLSFSNGYTAQDATGRKPVSNGMFQSRLNEFITLILKNTLPHRRDTEYYATKMGMSTRYLYRICKETTTQSPKEIIDGILIGGIKQALTAGIRPIGDIALDYGFEAPTAFGQYFKRHTGTTPSAFRKQFR